MTKTFKILILSLFVALCVATETQKHANVDYLSFGYDMFRGNPHSSQGVDPGFKFDRIFDLTYNNGAKSTDGAWDLPDSVTMARTDACTLNFQSSEIAGMESYQKSLEIEVTVSGGVPGIASFKASTDYKSMEKTTTTTNDKHIYSAAVCDVYKAKMSAFNPPKLHPEFIYALKSMPLEYEEQTYIYFLENYGTHAIIEINMGARYGMMSSISEKSYEQLKKESISTTFSASATIKGISGGIDTRTSQEKEWASKYTTAMTDYKIISVGAKPVANGDAVAWAQQAMEHPMPLRYTLLPLSELLTPLYLRGAIEESRMNAIRTNLRTASNNFCSNYLRPRGLVSDCDKPVNKIVPAKLNSCKWCADWCGGDFPVDGGHTQADQRWDDWAFTFGQGCSGGYGRRRVNSGVHLCCQQTDETRKGQCRVCNSCGNDYTENVGHIQVDIGWDEFTSAYDHGCTGASRLRGKPDGGFKICCKQDPICSMCSSCGGNWPHEAGVLAANKNNWSDWFRGRGWGCAGGVQWNEAKPGMKWCCKTEGTSPWSGNFLDIDE